MGNNEFEWPELYKTGLIIEKTDDEILQLETVIVVLIDDIYYHNEFV